MADSKEGWQLADNIASCKQDDISFRVDLHYPGRGLQIDPAGTRGIEGLSCLRISPQPPTPKGGETLIDAYARGRDLIATYAQTPARTSRPEIYWSIVNDDDMVGIEATIGVQTSLLDSDPTVRSSTSFPPGKLSNLASIAAAEWISLSAGDEVSAESASLFLFRPNDASWSYAEIVYPSDFQGAEVTEGDSSGTMQLNFALFPEFLEKGVIRKARIQALWLPREDDEALEKRRAVASPPSKIKRGFVIVFFIE